MIAEDRSAPYSSALARSAPDRSQEEKIASWNRDWRSTAFDRFALRKSPRLRPLFSRRAPVRSAPQNLTLIASDFVIVRPGATACEKSALSNMEDRIVVFERSAF